MMKSMAGSDIAIGCLLSANIIRWEEPSSSLLADSVGIVFLKYRRG